MDGKKVQSDSIHLYPEFKKDLTNDLRIAQSVWKLFDEADIIIAHNGDRFDIKWMNATFFKHNLQPPSPYRTIDTLKESKKLLRNNSHSLNDQSTRYNLGKKIDTHGFKLWAECMNGNIKAFERMLKYCRHDVRLLENWYLKLRPYMKQHPNMAINADMKFNGQLACPKCTSVDYTLNGYRYTQHGKFHRYKCGQCGSSFRNGANLLAGTKLIARV